MKIKEDIIKWREDLKKLHEQVSKFEEDSKKCYDEVAELKEQVSALVKITEEMTDAMLTLLRQQIGD